MKRWICFLLTLAMMLALAACAPEVPPEEPPVEEPPVEEGPAYWFEKEMTADKFSDEEGNLLASYSYQIMTMQTAETADEATVEMAERFNQGMAELLESALETGNELSEWAAFDETLAESDIYYVDEITATGIQKGSIYTVGFDSYGYTGGAHGYQAFYSKIFDLDRGEFIDPLEVADDPELFRATVTDQILDQIRNLDEEMRIGLFEGYESGVAEWNVRYVSYDADNVTVIFSAYDLGPYAMGALTFELPYEDLTDALGEGGQIRLGLLEAETAESGAGEA